MALTAKTISDLITDVRTTLDEPFDANTNFWTNNHILRMLNRGFREVWEIARQDKRSLWFVRRMRSTDSALTIFGVSYDPVNLRLSSAADELTLPPDCGEIKLFVSIPDANGVLPGIAFKFTGIGTNAFRSEVRSTLGGASQARYWCDMVQREAGPRLVFAPPLNVESAVETLLEYVIVPGEYGFYDGVTNALANSGFDNFLLDAVVAHAAYQCSLKPGTETEIVQKMSALWAGKAELVRERVGPHQTQDPELVEGDFEDEIENW